MQLWGGRFAKETSQLLRQFNDSIGFDQRFWREDVRGSQVWARGLAQAGVLSADEAEQIVNGLEQVATEWENGTFQLKDGDEDIHTANERRLTELVGAVGGKLHTGRSRNDQVATDFRLWVLGALDQLEEELLKLMRGMVVHAEQSADVILPGYTHLQHAQPILWGHWLLSHFWPLQRDLGRLQQVRTSTSACPLGSAALAGTAYPIDRAWLAQALGFQRITENSLDGVSNRDFAADFLYACTLLGVHLSRLSEQLILFSSAEFGFVRLDDAFTTGSSLMPQKKNPDTLELTRGKTGRLLGYLVGLLTTLKGLPSTYDKDLQEDKEGVFAAFDTLMIVLPVMAGVIETLQLRPERMAAQLEAGLLATDAADYLVKKGLPFRQAHHLVGRMVQLAEAQGCEINQLSLAQLRELSDLFSADLFTALTAEGSVSARNVAGGTGPQAVRQQIAQAKAVLTPHP